jgi:hypothetical protein
MASVTSSDPIPKQQRPEADDYESTALDAPSLEAAHVRRSFARLVLGMERHCDATHA